MLDGVVEAEAILRRVIEALVVGEGVGAEIGEAGGMGDLVAQDEELIVKLLELVGVLQAALDDGLPCGLAAGTVGLFLDAAHAGEGLLLAVELHGHAAADFLVLLGELGDLRFARDVFLAVNFHLRLDAAAIDLVERRQLAGRGRFARASA